jgi:hypothetical protein
VRCLTRDYRLSPAHFGRSTCALRTDVLSWGLCRTRRVAETKLAGQGDCKQNSNRRAKSPAAPRLTGLYHVAPVKDVTPRLTYTASNPTESSVASRKVLTPPRRATSQRTAKQKERQRTTHGTGTWSDEHRHGNMMDESKARAKQGIGVGNDTIPPP